MAGGTGKQTDPELIAAANETANNLINTLGVDPCLLAIVLIVMVCAGLIAYTYRHQERMERIRVEQFIRLTEAYQEGKNGDH